MLEVIRPTIVREKSALTLSYVLSTSSFYSDTDNTEDTKQDFSDTGGNEDMEWMARKFVASKSGYISTIIVQLGKTGSPAGSIYMEVYTDDGESTSMPNAQVADSGASKAVLCNDLDGSGAAQVFKWISDCPWVIAGETYWAVMKTIGYDYTDTTTETWWNTDANGATGLNECAKYDADATTKWTTIGADVGADIEVNMASTIGVSPGNTMVLLVDFTKGSSNGVQMQLEFSHNEKDWFVEGDDSTTSSVVTTAPRERKVADGGNIAIELGDLCFRCARISAKALTDSTNAELGLTALVGWK